MAPGIEIDFKIHEDFPEYIIYDTGEVYSIRSKKFLMPHEKRSGYEELILFDTNRVKKYVLIHRLVAECFCIKNNIEANEVNHINGDKHDNRAVNLEWVTRSENLKHAFETGLRTDDVTPKSIIATNIETGEQMLFKSIYSAAKFLNISKGNICQACKGLRPYAGGYYWEYTEQEGE